MKRGKNVKDNKKQVKPRKEKKEKNIILLNHMALLFLSFLIPNHALLLKIPHWKIILRRKIEISFWQHYSHS